MKLTAVLLTVFCLHVAATGNTQTLTLSLKNVSMETAFKEIEGQSGYSFIYLKENLKDIKSVTLKTKNEKLETVLQLLFKDRPLSYTLSGRHIVVKQKTETLTIDTYEVNNEPPPIDVRGRIVNEKGEPVAASIVVKGTNKGTTTNTAGTFELKGVEGDAVLVISGVGLETVEINVAGREDLGSIQSKIKMSVGEEVKIEVNTGYQKIKPQNFVGSFSQLDSAAYNRRAGMGIISRLDGMVNSILFDKKAGNQYPMQIRGISTLSSGVSPSSSPLIVVDNFPFRQDLSAINPNDVENITVLKDAAATSIWGAQAGNGVIVITTKKGRYNQSLRTSIQSNITVQNKPDQYYYPQMRISDFIDAEIFLFNKGYYDAALNNTTTWPMVSPVVELLESRRSGKVSAADSANTIEALKTRDTRSYLDAYAYRPAILQQHFISVSGGAALFNYSLSGGYNRDLNNVNGSKADDQFTLNANSGFIPVQNLEINTGFNYSRSNKKSVGFAFPKLYPYAELMDEQGHSLAIPSLRRLAYLDTVGGGNLLDWKYRPLDEPGLSDRHDVITTTILNFTASYKILNWLSAAATYQYSNQASSAWNYNSLQTYFTRDLINQYTNLAESSSDLRNPVPIGGIVDLSQTELKSQNVRGQLNFNKSFRPDHQITALLAGEVLETKLGGNRSRMYGYDKDKGSSKTSIDYLTPFLLYSGIYGSTQVPNNNRPVFEKNNRFVSFLGNISYTYKGRYNFYSSARKDGSNVFGVNTNKKWKPLWSVGASWDLSKENFYKIDWMPMLRIKASYGYTGNPGNATGLPTIIYGSNLADYSNLMYAYPSNPPNPDLRWEKVRIINTGLEFRLWNNRVSGGLDVWQKLSTDIISTTPVAPSTGSLQFIINSANLKGKGFDLTLTSNNLQGSFKWETSFGLSYAKTVVTKLYKPVSRARNFIDYGLNPYEGRMAFGLVSFRWAGLDPLTGDPQGYINKQVSKNYAAIGDDSVGNQVFNGSAIPLYFGFLRNNFTWKQFTLSANITYRLDFYFRKPTISYLNMAKDWLGHSDYAQRWQKSGDEQFTNIPSFTYPLNSARDEFFAYSEVNVLRGDNIRLQDIRLQYDWGNRKQKRLPFNGLHVFVYANDLNLIIWRKNKSGLDPDFVGGGSFLAPTPKSWTVGVTLNL